MAKINSLRDIIQFNSNFKTAINLYLSLNKAEKVLGYIPTKSSVSFLGEYLKAVLENKEQATLLVGPYGKGKSHLLLVLLAVLSMKKTPESESAINELIDNVSKTDEVGERVSEYIGQVWDKKRFLPVLITDTTGDLNQAFLYGLNDALKRDGLLDLAPETYYSIALDRIDDWEQNYFETYKMFERELTQNGMSIAELKTDLKQYSQKTLILFKEIYPKVTAGSEFNPMALADALPLYKSVSEKLVDEYKVYLDINKIKDGEQKEIEDPALTQIPDPYASYLHYQTLSEKYDFSKSGTLVIWKKCDRISPKTRGPLTERLEFSLGQKFRYFIHDGVSKIKIVCDENPDVAVDVAPNDPLFLMEDNCVLCHQDDPKKVFKPGEANGIEAPFELYTAKGDATGEVQIPIKYIDKNGNKAESSVLVRFSIVKNKFYDETAFPKGINPGNYALGKHAAKMEGISVVRARREIDFRRFDYYNVVNEPQHRWWGCEIIFTPELDEAFGVANNKQYVELKKVDVEDLDPDEVDIPPIWDQLADTIISTIKAMYAQNKETRNNTRTFDDTQSPSTDIINTVENDPATSDIDDENEEDEETPPEVIAETGKEELKEMPKKGEHSREAKELVTEIIARLEDIPDGCAECFPFELIDELKQEYLTDNSL